MAVVTAALLSVGKPVIRLDGLPMDAVSWAAVLCAQIESGTATPTPA